MKKLWWVGLLWVCLGLVWVSTRVWLDSVNAQSPQDGTPQPQATRHTQFNNNASIPTYYANVEPIIEAKCLGCHSEGQIGYARYPMNSPQDIIDFAEDVAYVVETRYMPPWMPGDQSPAFHFNPSLTEEQIDTIIAWEAGGAPLGDESTRANEEFAYTAPTMPSIREDLVLTIPSYTPDTKETDLYRCFLLDPQFIEDTYVTAYQLIAGAPEIVHHIIAYQASPRMREATLAIDGVDGQPGWDCSAMAIQAGAGGFTTAFYWLPGTLSSPYPRGTGVLVPKESLIVLRVHYNLEAGTQPDQTKVVLQLAQPDEDILPLHGLPLLAPVELPCPQSIESEACSREYAMEHASSGIEGWILWRCGKSEEDYIHQDAAHVVSSCDYRMPEDAIVVRIGGHMHERGTSLHIELEPDTDYPTTLLDIPVWDFHWQNDYTFAQPVIVKSGQTIRLTCTWDNSESNRYIVWGKRTEDEMCLAQFQYVLTEGIDVQAFLEQFQEK
jgi:hypothetical protein